MAEKYKVQLDLPDSENKKMVPRLKIFLHMIKKRLEHARNTFTYAEFCRIHVLCFGVQPFNHPQLPRNCCT